ncbi:MAG: trehalose utilization protein, partial [Planctomycetaceae bacterium]|nr:trehalose utilization protein [Planctomycetaceae bacterium]
VAAESINVLVWDERQPRQSEAYDNFLGNEIARRLEATESDFELRSVALDDPKQGLSDDNLSWADVIIWWGHVRQNQVTEENARRVLERIKSGDLDLIALHSAHWARPFTYAMDWRSIEDVRRKMAKIAEGKKIKIETVKPPREFTVPIHGAVQTPAIFGYKEGCNDYRVVIHLPYCCFPDYRPDGASSTLTATMADHPIAVGLGG